MANQPGKLWNPSRYMGFDFETSGEREEYALQPWRRFQDRDFTVVNLRLGRICDPHQLKKFWATSLAYVWPKGASMNVNGGLNPTREMMERMLYYAVENNLRIVGWNTPFDIAVLLAYGLEELVFRAKWLDGMLLWRHATIEPEYGLDRSHKATYGLKTCVEKLWPLEAGYEEGVDFHDDDSVVRKKLHTYNIRDVGFTLRAAAHWWDTLTLAQQRCALIEAEALPWVARANLHGIPVDPFMLTELSGELAADAEQRLARLQFVGASKEIIASPVKLRKLLFEDWKLPPIKVTVAKKTKVTNLSTDKEVLYELAHGYRGRAPDLRVKALLEYRQAVNARTKFAEGPLESSRYNEDDHTHPLAMVFGTYTGRVTYSSKQGKGVKARPIGFAIAQEKRDKRFRAPVVAPLGYDLVEFDAIGQEFRWMAVASGDETMLRLCLPGEDAHSYLGSRIDGCDYRTLIDEVAAEENYAPDQPRPRTQIRLCGKVGNLSLQYRTSAARLLVTARVDYGLPMVMAQSEKIHKTYRRTYVDVPEYWTRQIRRTMERGYVETFAGRRVQVQGDWTGPSSWELGSTAINYRIQGTGADQKYLAMAALAPVWTKHNAYFAWDLHDGIYSFVPKDKTKGFIAEAKHLLDNLPYYRVWGIVLPVPMHWDAKLGPSWGMLKKWEP